jgi:hypothetical protein
MGAIGGMTGVVMGTLLLGGIALLVVGVRARRDGGSGAVVATALVVAAAAAVLSAIGAIAALVGVLLQNPVGITVPVQEFWPQLPAGAEVGGTTATRLSGGFTTADLVIADLSIGARLCWAIALALGWLVPGAVAALIAVGCLRLRAGRPFAPLLERLTMITAVVVLAGGLLAEVLGDIAGSMAAQEALAWSSAAWADGSADPAALLPQPGFRVDLPLWPVGAGLGLAALATVLRHGRQLQHDSDGLV